MYRTSNPTIKNMQNYCSGEDLADETKTASYVGVALKALLYVGLAIASAVAAAVLLNVNTGLAGFLLGVSVLGAFICSMIASFIPATCPVSGSLYAIFEGFAVGALSALFDAFYSGIVLAALLSTFVTFGIMMVLYATGAIRVGSRFRSFMISALLAICVTQLLIFLVSLFFDEVYYIFYGNGIIGLLVSAVMVVFSALFILIDLSDITMLVDGRMDKKYEWRAAFGLSVTLIWLYLEFLRFFAIVFSRRSK